MGTGDYWQWWASLPDVTRTGTPIGHHDAPPEDPYWGRYIAGQFELARLSASEVATKLNVPPAARSVLDIGGGHGWYSAELCRRHPRLAATVLDLPGSAAVGREIIAAAGMSDRVRHLDGDARNADLGGRYDLVLCFNIVHHLDPGQIIGLFTRIRAALRPGGSLAVMDAFAVPSRRSSAAANLLGMFVYLSSGAQAYTPAQLRGWLHETGFASPRRVSVRRIPGQGLYQAMVGR
jgi:cyclopropane fatty-acyl-phospholipid synthase-like methyltransferase